MNKMQILLTGVGVSVLAVSTLFIKSKIGMNPDFAKFKSEHSKEEAQEIQGALDYYHLLTANQVTGKLNPADIRAAREKAQSMMSPDFKKTRAFANMKWSETGPNDVGGRTRTLIADKNIPNKLYMGAVAGGFWTSTDNGNTWSKRAGNDSSTAISIGAIAQAANGDIYYGTGEGHGEWAGGSINNGIFALGEGIFKSTDGGVTFTQLPSTKPSNLNSATEPWSYVNKIVTDPNNSDRVIAGTYGGLKITTNGGTTWAKPSSLNATANFIDLAISTDGSKVMACTGANLYISADGGATFGGNIMGSNGLPASGVSRRMQVAIAPNDGNTMYITIAASNGSFRGLYKSIDAGASWSALILGGGSFNPFGDQGWYDIALGVHPTNKDMVFLGGQLELVRYTPASGPQTIAFWLGAPQNVVHADMHGIMFNPNDPENMYVLTDGGFYRTFNCSAPSPVFAEKNKNYNATQCYGIAANYLGKIIFGSQDNGSGFLGDDVNSALASRNLTGGDGMRCAMSDLLPNFLFTSIYNGKLFRAGDGGQNNASFKSFYDLNIDKGAGGGAPDGLPDEGGLWVAPIEFKEKQVGSEIKSVFLYGGNSSVWMTQGALKGNPIWFKLFSPGGAGFSALSMSKDGKTVFAGTQGGAVYRISVPSLWDSVYRYTDTISNLAATSGIPFPLFNSCITKLIATYPSRYITDLSCGGTDGNTLLVTLANYGNSSYIYKSLTAVDSLSPAFTDITSNLPKMPIYTSLCLNGSSTKLMIGADLGVWGSDNGGTSWSELNMMNADESTWHPRLSVYELVEKDHFSNADANGGGYRNSVIYSGTHGRGTFRSTSLSLYFPSSTSFLGNHTGTISLYPNPTVNSSILEYEAETASKVSIKIYSLTGTLIREEWSNVIVGKNQINLNTSNLAQGGYIVYLNDNGKRASSKLIKQ